MRLTLWAMTSCSSRRDPRALLGEDLLGALALVVQLGVELVAPRRGGGG